MSAPAPRLVILALDGATPEIMGPLLAEGFLPNLREVMGADGLRRLQSTVPAVTPCAWTSIFTGAGPVEHGVWDFVRVDARSGEIHLTSPAELPRMVTVWEDLCARGMTVGLFNVPWTHPYPGINGYVVPGFGAMELSEDNCRPAGLRAEITGQFGAYPVAPQDEWYRYGRAAALEAIRRRIRQKFEIAAHLIRQHPTDVMALGLMEVDAAGHTSGFWPHDMDDPTVIADSGIGQVYRSVDQELPRLLEAVPGDAALVVLSDHGQGQSPRRIDLLGMLQRMGAFRIAHPFGLPPGLYRLMVRLVKPVWRLARMRSGGKRQGALRRADQALRPHFEWSRCRAMPWGTGSAGFVTFNPSLSEDDQRLWRQTLRTQLERAGLHFEELPAGPGDGANPDFLVHPPGPSVYFRTAAGRWGRVMVEGDDAGRIAHAPHGVLMVSAGPWREHWETVAQVTDCAPAIAATVMPDTQWRPTAREGASERSAYSADEEKLVSDRLRRLGYL